MAGRRAQRKDLINPGEVSAVGACWARRDRLQRLQRMETIEELLEFDLTSMQLYADSIVEERQRLTQELSQRRNP